MKSCQKIQKLLLEEAAAQSPEITAHLSECGVCRAFRQDVDALRQWLQVTPRREVPEELSDRVSVCCLKELGRLAQPKPSLATSIARHLRALRRLDLAVPVTALAFAATLSFLFWLVSPQKAVTLPATDMLGTYFALTVLLQNFIMLLLAPLLWRFRPKVERSQTPLFPGGD
jgi:predicted anti-sigma-YlaC factor YlaD